MNAATRDEYSALEPLPLGTVDIGDALSGTAQRITVRPLKVGQVPATARALRPLAAEVEALLADGLTPGAVLTLLADHTERVVEVLCAATGAPAAAVQDSTVEQLAELLLAVLAANKDFLRGRLVAALRTAAAGAGPGAGPTPSRP